MAFCLWQLFLILQLLKTKEIWTGWWDGFATDDLASIAHSYFTSVFIGVRKCGAFQGVALLKWCFSGREQASVRQNTNSRRRHPAGLAFVCRCSKRSVRWQLIIFSPCVNMSWLLCLLFCIFRAVLVPGGPQVPGFSFPRKGGGGTSWPQRTILVHSSPGSWFQSCFITQIEDQTAQHPSAAVTWVWLYVGAPAGEFRCPPPRSDWGWGCGCKTVPLSEASTLHFT